MKRLIFLTFFGSIWITTSWSQILEIREIGIAENVTDTLVSRHIFLKTQYDHPRVKVDLSIINQGDSPIIFDIDYFNRDQFRVYYIYDNEEYTSKCSLFYNQDRWNKEGLFPPAEPAYIIMHNDSEVEISPGKSLDFFITFSANAAWGDNYVDEFMKIAKTLTIEYKRIENGEVKYHMYTSPFEYNSMTLSRKEPEFDPLE